jgi:uncharacterized protein (DUF1786 family)
MTIDTPLLAIDVGRGTQDILVYTPGQSIENSAKFVLPAPTVVAGERIRHARETGRPVFLEGFVMGGGGISLAIRRHLSSGLAVYATEQAAATLHDDPGRVRATGVRITDTAPDDAVCVHTTDYMEQELRAAFSRFCLEYPRNIAVAVQDHGFSPTLSNRIFRFQHMQGMLDRGDWQIFSLIADPPDPDMTRMQAIHMQVPAALVTDTGPAALIGALCDPFVREKAETGITLVNAGNGHTLCCTLRGEEIYGIFEHHTGALDQTGLMRHIRRLQDGTLDGREIFEEGGHGAAVRKPLSADAIAVTGPNRRRLLPDAYQAAPFGDMMLTGCFGLLRVWEQLRESR